MPTTSPTRTTPATVVLPLTLLPGIQPVTTDLGLSALPTLQRELGASVAAGQLTLSALIIGFGLARRVCGPLADRRGRRAVLLAGPARGGDGRGSDLRTLDGTDHPLTLGVGACSVVRAATAWTLLRRDGAQRPAPAGGRP